MSRGARGAPRTCARSDCAIADRSAAAVARSHQAVVLSEATAARPAESCCSSDQPAVATCSQRRSQARGVYLQRPDGKRVSVDPGKHFRAALVWRAAMRVLSECGSHCDVCAHLGRRRLSRHI